MWWWLIGVVAGLGWAGQTSKLCDNVILEEGRLRLNRNQETLICGSSKSREGWRDVPLAQAQYHLKVLLQNEGFPTPRFARDGDLLRVWPGPQQKTTKFVIRGADSLLNPKKKRKLVKAPLDPRHLDEAKRWAELNLKSNGFACPTINVIGQVWDGQVVMTVEPGDRAHIGDIRRTGLEGLDEDALARYEAVSPGQRYDVRKAELSASRFLDAGLFQSAYYKTTCRGQVADLDLYADVGRARVFRFGVGASTEEFPFVDVWFRNARLDDRASSLTGTLHVSPILQSLNLRSELYILPWSKRSFLGPRLTTARESERTYEVLQNKIGADLGRNWDMWDLRLLGRVGPTINYVNTVQGLGPDDATFLSWEGQMLIMSHDYEFQVRDQFVGWLSHLKYQGQRKGIGSELNVDRYDLSFKHLWNLGNYSPPLFILGTRLDLVGVDAHPVELEQKRNLLPIEYRIFYGGDQNLRGFPRQRLTNQGLGYLTAAYVGFELRLIEQLPYRLQPFLLWDGARLGQRRYALDPPFFSSGGFGLRWASPVGTLRGSAARGRIWQGDSTTDIYPQEWVYFLSFGQEF